MDLILVSATASSHRSMPSTVGAMTRGWPRVAPEPVCAWVAMDARARPAAISVDAYGRWTVRGRWGMDGMVDRTGCGRPRRRRGQATASSSRDRLTGSVGTLVTVEGRKGVRHLGPRVKG